MSKRKLREKVNSSSLRLDMGEMKFASAEMHIDGPRVNINWSNNSGRKIDFARANTPAPIIRRQKQFQIALDVCQCVKICVRDSSRFDSSTHKNYFTPYLHSWI
jgi:hypothetical protein